MKWFYDMKISGKMILSFLIVAIITAVVGIMGVVNLSTNNKEYTNLYKNYGMSQGQLGYISEEFQKSRAATRDLIIETDTQNFKQYEDIISQSDKTIEDNLKKYKMTCITADDQADYENLVKVFNEYSVTRDKVVALAVQNKNEEAYKVLKSEGVTAAANASKIIDSMIANNVKIGLELAQKQENTSNKIVIILIIAVIVAVIVAISLGLFLANLIGKSIKKVADAANKLSKGDTNIEIDINSKDELGILAKSFEKIVVAIQNLVSDANMLSGAAIEGKLKTRADVSKHQGDYRKIVEGVNETLDTVIKPINESIEVLTKISNNDLESELSSGYKGNLKELTDTINAVKDRLRSIENVFIDISNGDTKLLEPFKKVGKRSQNDRLLPASIRVMESLRSLITEANMIAKAAVDGNLQVRGNADKFEGGYKEIIQGMNNTMEAVDRPIQQVSEVLQKMADGDLTNNITTEYKGLYAKMIDSMNMTINSLNDVMKDINGTAGQVASGSRQVSNGSQALSQGATEQASAIEELTASITQVATQTKENAVNANQANELALKAKSNAELGNEQMKDMLKSMNDINKSSSNISKIIKVIDDIAFQTNILALNAAVEAARAGQHGKGFAVVAEEVRNLAARSANAAKETTDLIDGSIKNVEAGTEIANSTAKALNEIVNGVAKSADIVGNIALASNEQAAAIAQINKGVEQVSQVIQTNSATAEESAAASEELSSQAEILRDMVGKFKLKKGNSSYSEFEQSRYSAKENYVKGDMGSYYRETSSQLKPKINLNDSEFGKY